MLQFVEADDKSLRTLASIVSSSFSREDLEFVRQALNGDWEINGETGKPLIQNSLFGNQNIDLNGDGSDIAHNYISGLSDKERRIFAKTLINRVKLIKEAQKAREEKRTGVNNLSPLDRVRRLAKFHLNPGR
jgi:hypothetical protein